MALFSASAYLTANPDVADYYYNNRDQVGGMDLNQWAKKHWDTYGQDEGRSRGNFTKGEAGAASRNEYMLGGSQEAYGRARQNDTTDYTVTKDGNLISWSPSTGTVVHNNVPQGYIDYVNEYNRANEESSLARGWDLENDGFEPTPVPGLGSPIGQGGGYTGIGGGGGGIGSGVGGNLGGGVGGIGIGGTGIGNPYVGPSDPAKWLYPVPGQPRSPAGFGFNPYSQNTSSLWQNTVYTPWGFGGAAEQPAGGQAPGPQPQPQPQSGSIWDPLSVWKNNIGTALGLPPDFGTNSFGNTQQNMARGGAVRRQGALSILANKAFRR